MGKRTLREVTIGYGYDSNEWESITVEYSDGRTVRIGREQIDAFKRMHKVVKDLQDVERLRDELVSIFGEKTKIATSPK